MDATLIATLLIALALIVAVTMSLWVVAAWRFTRSWCTPRRLPAKRSPAAYGLPYEQVEIASGTVILRGWFIPPDESPSATVILTHAWSGNGGQLLPLARRLHEGGLGVLIVDSRGQGASDSGGLVTIASLARDLIAALDALTTRPDIDAGRIGVVGHSIGGASAILAASVDVRIRAVASVASFADTVNLTTAALRARGPARRVLLPLVRRFIERSMQCSMRWASPVSRIASVRVPVLLVQGSVDRLVPREDLDAIARRAGPGTTAVIVDGRDHFDILRDAGTGSHIAAFMGRQLDLATFVRSGGQVPERAVRLPFEPPPFPRAAMESRTATGVQR